MVNSIILQQHMTLVAKPNKILNCNNQTRYDAIYDALKYLSDSYYALPKFHITTNRNIHGLLINNELIQEVKELGMKGVKEYRPKTGYKSNTDYYIISERGREYMKSYEQLQKVLGENG